MKEIFLLTRILLKSSTSDGKQKGEKRTKGLGRILFFILVYGYIVGFMGYISCALIKSLVLVNQPAVFLNLSFVILLGFGVIQTVITSLNILYFSRDLDFLLPLPITPKKIVISKLNCLVVSQYIMSALLVLPGIIMYGYLLNLGFMYYIIAGVSLLLFPIIPVALISFLVTIIMKFTKIIKNKEIVQYLTIILTLLLIIGVQGLTGTTGNPSSEEIANSLIKTNGLVEMFSKAFPTINLTMNSLLNYNNINGIFSIIMLAVISIVFYYLISCLISKLYVKTVISLTTIKSKKVGKIDNIKNLNTNSTCWSYIKKEFKLLVRNPIFFMQCVLPSIIFPIIITVPVFIEFKNSGTDMSLLQNDFSNIINTSFGFMCLMIATLLFFIFNYTSVTSISRDGQNAVFMKYIPVSLEKQILYKIMPGLLLNMIPILYVIIFEIICIPGIKLKTILYVATISILINVLNNILMIIVDLRNPKLKWMTEQAVVKQNFNMFYVMAFIGLEAVLVLGLGTFVVNVDYLANSLILIIAIIIMVLKKYISKNKEKIFDRII